MKFAFFIAATLWSQAVDVAGSADPFLFRRVPGFQITEFKEVARASMAFKTDGKPDSPVEGRKTVITYRNSGPSISPESILQHYERSALGLGGKRLHQAPQMAYFLVQGKTSEMWLSVESLDANQYRLNLVEGAVALPETTPDDLASTFDREGRIALYIKFKMDEDVIQPESKDEIARASAALKRTSAKRINIEGHTDFIGNPENNRVLSKARAKSVMDALVALGADPARFTVAGYGQDRPLADDKTDEGRAKNRRIELVNPDFQPSTGAKLSTNSHPKDAKDAHDDPMFPRKPGYYLAQADIQDPGQAIFAVGKPGESKDVTVVGRRQDLIYRFDGLGGKPMPGPEQILKADPGSVQFVSSSAVVVKLGEVWARITAASGEQYSITIVTPR